ncbi:MAG: YceD family protein [Betaproteobacteria bacterium]
MSPRHRTAATRLDAFALARDHGVLEGRVDARELDRVRDVLADGPADVAWRIEGGTDDAGRPALSIALTGAVPLTCQRCLDEFDWPLEYRSAVLLAQSPQELEALDDLSGAEVVLAGAPIDPLALVEDELVLALPFAPRHPDGACGGNWQPLRSP